MGVAGGAREAAAETVGAGWVEAGREVAGSLAVGWVVVGRVEAGRGAVGWVAVGWEVVGREEGEKAAAGWAAAGWEVAGWAEVGWVEVVKVAGWLRAARAAEERGVGGWEVVARQGRGLAVA